MADMNANPFRSKTRDEALAAEVRAEIARQSDASISAIADRLGIRRATLTARTSGHVPFTYSQLHAVAGVLGIHPFELIRRAEEVMSRDANRKGAA
ncbi:hypothetical protein ACQP60_18805 [Isoptericola variabilis]|uniref:hypothetical protein n=1 Tax=Isoptericola variabilis TaxID=139208 RepID=UPI003D2548A7